MLDSVIKVNKKYYPQTLFKEYKYEIKRTKQKIVLMMIQNQVHLSNLIVTLIMRLIMNLKMNLTMNLTMRLIINLVISLLMNLKFKLHFNNNKSLIVYVNRELLGFYLCMSYFL